MKERISLPYCRGRKVTEPAISVGLAACGQTDSKERFFLAAAGEKTLTAQVE
jgi:hypothetical protein